MARGGGFRNERERGGGGGRRRSRTPPNSNSNSNANSQRSNNNSNNNNNSSGPSAPQNTAATQVPPPSFMFDMRRLVAAAFQKFSTELAAVTKDDALKDVFSASEEAAFFDPAQGGSRQSALTKLEKRLEEILKSREVAEWMMEKAQSFINPQPKKLPEPKIPPQLAASAAAVRTTERFTNQAVQNQSLHQRATAVLAAPSVAHGGISGDFNVHHHQQQPQPQQVGFNFNNRFNNSSSLSGVGGPNRFQQQQHQAAAAAAALLPDPSDPKIVVIRDLPDDLNNEQNVRITINNRANNNIVKSVLCEQDKRRAVVFCFDDSQAALLRAFPPGTVFVRAPDAHIVECDAATWKHALGELRNKVLERENLALLEINQITAQEEGIPLDEVLRRLPQSAQPQALVKSDGAPPPADSERAAAASASRRATEEEILTKREISQLKQQREEISTSLEKYRKELTLLESLGDSIALISGQPERKVTVEQEVQTRTCLLEECEKTLSDAEAKLSKILNPDVSDGDSQSAEQERAATVGESAERREKRFSSSSASIGDARAILFFSGFSTNPLNDVTEGASQDHEQQHDASQQQKGAWSDAKILALLKHIPQVEPLHIWRSPKNTDVCVELAGGRNAVSNVTNFLSFNDFVFCGLRVTRNRPQQ